MSQSIAINPTDLQVLILKSEEDYPRLEIRAETLEQAQLYKSKINSLILTEKKFNLITAWLADHSKTLSKINEELSNKYANVNNEAIKKMIESEYKLNNQRIEQYRALLQLPETITDTNEGGNQSG
jgi:hypothetical protein